MKTGDNFDDLVYLINSMLTRFGISILEPFGF